MREIEYLKVIENTLADSSLIGDDCAFLEQLDICVTQDTLVEDIHFSINTITPYQLGQKAVNVNLSDLAAAGAKPLYITISLSMPKTSGNDFVEEFYKGVQYSCEKYKVKVAGGDLTGSEKYFVSVCAIGRKYNDVRVSRSFAKQGDIIITTGFHGDSAGGLKLIQKGQKAPQCLINKHLVPVARIQESEYIMNTAKQEGVSELAMMDTSDGLGDAVCKLSGACNLEFDLDYIPVSDILKHTFPDTYNDIAMWGGEDFELLFTVPEKLYDKLDKTKFIKIGRVSDRPFSSEREREFEQKSFKHFED